MPYLESIGVTGSEYQKTSKLILDVLKNKGMSTHDIKKALQINKSVSGIISLMCDQGLLIRGLSKGGWKSNSHTYYPFRDYFSDVDLNEMPEAKARKLLVQRYLGSFGPVTEKDISWWSGLKKTQVRQALEEIEGQITHLNISGLENDFVMLRSDKNKTNSNVSKKKAINLLPVQDPYVMGYKDRGRYLDLDHYNNVFDRGGNATSTIMVDSSVIGVWDFEEDKIPQVKLFFFKEVEENLLRGIYSKGEKIGKFICGRGVHIKECDFMIPLTQRTMGGFMSPLKDC